MAKLVIWPGKRAPHAVGVHHRRSSIAAAMRLMALPPPISSDITAQNVRPRYSSTW
jgi:hypothetical protein